MKVFNNFLGRYTALPVKDGYRESYTWSKNKLAKMFSAPKFADPAQRYCCRKIWMF